MPGTAATRAQLEPLFAFVSHSGQALMKIKRNKDQARGCTFFRLPSFYRSVCLHDDDVSTLTVEMVIMFITIMARD